MKYIIIALLSFCSVAAVAQSGIYDLQVKTYKDQQVNLSSLKGKKILVAVLSMYVLKNGGLAFLDSVQAKNPNVKIIAMPVTASTDSADIEQVDSASKNLKSSITISRPEKVKKSDGAAQNNLMRWLTDANQNKHFNAEVRTDQQFYLVSKYGALYAVLELGVPVETINSLLNQADLREYPYLN